MSKLKSLKEFKEQGLNLSREQQASIHGGDGEEHQSNEFSDVSDTYYFKSTTSGGGDCNRCANTDDGYYIDPNAIFK